MAKPSSDLAKLSEWSKPSLAHEVTMLSTELKRKGKVGGPTASALGYTVNATLRHTLDSLLGPASKAPKAQKIAMALAALALAGFRLGLSSAKATHAAVGAATVTEASTAALTERLFMTLGAPPDGATAQEKFVDAVMRD